MLPLAVVLAMLAHSSAIVLYETLKPEPLPVLSLKFHGKGAGSVMTQPVGLSCTDNCSAEFAPGTEIRLVAVLQEGSTFEGWSDNCVPRPDWVLECSLTLTEDTRVHIGFGLVPEQLNVAWMETEQPEERDELTITLPDPEIEAELLTEPIEELLAQAEPTPPEPEKQPPPPPQPQPTAPAPQVQQPQAMNMRSVEVPDENEVEEAPDDATHLSDKNRDVAEETHAKQTNLDRAQAGESVNSEESDIQSEDIGGKEDDIAQLEEAEPTTLDNVEEELGEAGEDDKLVGVEVGEDGDQGEDGEAGDDRPSDKPGVLAMRGIEGRGSIVADDTKTGQGGKLGKLGKKGRKGIKTQLEFEDYERIVGKDKADKELALARTKQKSKRRGRWEKKLGAVKSALENFTPEIKPGNQTALKTRAAPFAVYIARMHRRIHELWGFGFLSDLDDKAADHPLNNWELYTKIEIIINPDGSVHKTNIVAHSGLLEFDVAAIDTILTAAPYEPTPKKIRSPDGRVYIHWGFNRNWRQCGTFNAQPFIRSDAPADADNGVDDGDLVRRVPRRSKRGKASKPAARKPEQMPTRPSSSGSGDTRASLGLPSPQDAKAIHTANLWLNGFTQRNVNKMLKVTGAPFRSKSIVVANSVREVGAVYKLVMKETKGPLRDWKLLSAAGYRKRFGALPPGIEVGKPQLLMVVIIGKDRFTLVMERSKSGDYKIIALHR